mgnify:FL=1
MKRFALGILAVLICWFCPGFLLGGQVVVTTSPFGVTVDGSPLIIDEVYFVDTGEATYGGGRLQACFRAEGTELCVYAMEGFACECRPGGQFWAINSTTTPFEVLWTDRATTSVTVVDGVFTATDGDFVRTTPLDFDGDGAVGLGDYFLFLDRYFHSYPSADVDGSGTVDTGDVYAFLEGWYS